MVFLDGYFGLALSIARAAIAGAETRQIRTTAELAAASRRNEPASSPTASNVSATASTASEPFARLLTRILLLLATALMPISAGSVRYTRPISELATSPAMTTATSGVPLKIEYVKALTPSTPRSGYSNTLMNARSGSLPAIKLATEGLNE